MSTQAEAVPTGNTFDKYGSTNPLVRRLMDNAEPAWSATQVRGGLSSGEGLITALADATVDAEGNRPFELKVHGAGIVAWRYRKL